VFCSVTTEPSPINPNSFLSSTTTPNQPPNLYSALLRTCTTLLRVHSSLLHPHLTLLRLNSALLSEIVVSQTCPLFASLPAYPPSARSRTLLTPCYDATLPLAPILISSTTSHGINLPAHVPPLLLLSPTNQHPSSYPPPASTPSIRIACASFCLLNLPLLSSLPPL
jgi:hypothetical protein